MNSMRCFQCGLLAAVSIAVLTSGLAAADADALSQAIDEHIEARLDAAKVERVPLADDAEFIRRVYLDLHGVVPSAKQTADFLRDDATDKRAKLIDELLASPRFGEHLADIWRKYLISPLVNEQRQQTERFTTWLADRFNSDPWDQIATELLTASGKLEENPAVTYLIEGRFPLGVTDLTDLSTRYFLGVRLNCAQCHDHPHVAWKQQDYWGLAAFFSQIQTPGRPKTVYLAGIKDDPKLTMASLRDADMLEGYRPEPPTFLGSLPLESSAQIAQGQTHRAALAAWITSPENPYFARAAANRMWWHFFGRGIVNPVDDMHSGNSPSHPELLQELSRQFAESGFDLKFLCRGIVSSRTYQSTSRPGSQPDQELELFARMPIKSLTAEQLYDSLVAILGPPAKTPSIDARFGARHEFCQFFSAEGDPEPTRYDRGIPHLLRLMNSPQFAGRSLKALVAEVTAAEDSEEEITEALYLTILSRRPTADEQKQAQEYLAAAGNSPQAAYSELAWALLLSSEFSLNH
jgi:hypothetical protein